MNVPSNEPPDGDFARYVEALVGKPPEDPASAAWALSQRLRNARVAIETGATVAEARAATTPMTSSGAADVLANAPATPAGSGATQSGVGRSLGAVTATATLAAVARGVSTVLIFAGAAWIAVAMLAPDHLAIDPLPGVVALFAGIFVRRKATIAPPARI